MQRKLGRKIGLGVIGCGSRIRHVIKNVLSYDQESRIQITGVYDPDPLSVNAMSDEFSGHSYRIYASLDEAVNNPDTDWIFIGSWNCFHAEHAIAALKHGKHIFCEKPLAISLDECLAIQDAATHGSSIFAFGLVLRYVELYQEIHRIVSEGHIGKIISLEFNETLHFSHGGYIHGNWRRFRKNAGTHLLEKCCHDYDIVNWLTQSIPIRVASFGGNDYFTPSNIAERERVGKTREGISAFQTWSDPHKVDPFTSEKDIVDNQVAILQYANGIRASFHTNCCSGIPERRIYICGTEGALRADWDTLEYKRIGQREILHAMKLDISGGHGGGDERMALGVYECLLGNGSPMAGLKEGLLSAIACFGVDEACDTGNVVDLTDKWQRAGIRLEDYSSR